MSNQHRRGKKNDALKATLLFEFVSFSSDYLSGLYLYTYRYVVQRCLATDRLKTQIRKLPRSFEYSSSFHGKGNFFFASQFMALAAH